MRWRFRTAHATGTQPWQCPVCVNCRDCKQRFADEVDLEAGLCICCRALTGRCGAGRFFRNPNPLEHDSYWGFACPRMGAVPRTFTLAGRDVTALLCGPHNQQVDNGEVPWLWRPPTLAAIGGTVPFIAPPLPTVASVAGPGPWFPPPPGTAASNLPVHARGLGFRVSGCGPLSGRLRHKPLPGVAPRTSPRATRARWSTALGLMAPSPTPGACHPRTVKSAGGCRSVSAWVNT
jgi:hypothetical protein